MSSCVVCTRTGNPCQNPSSKVFPALPRILRTRVCRVLLASGHMESCGRGDCGLCTLHLRYALIHLLQSPVVTTTKALLEAALCKHAGFTSDACEEFLTATEGLQRWTG